MLVLLSKFRVQDEVARINTEIVDGVTGELGQLTSFYLGVTNEWLEAMVITSGGNKVRAASHWLKVLLVSGLTNHSISVRVFPDAEVRQGGALLSTGSLQVSSL